MKTSASTRTKLPGVKRFWTKPDELLAIEWTGFNLEDMQAFVGLCRDDKGMSMRAFRASRGLVRPYAGGELYDSDKHVWVPIEIGEWVMKTGQFSYTISDPEEIAEDYEEV